MILRRPLSRPAPVRFAPLVFLLTLAACTSPDAPDARPTTADAAVTDDLGRSVSLPSPPARVLALAPSLTETVYAVGAGGRLVGASPSDTYPPRVRALPSFSTFPLDHERVVSLRPDVLLATDQVNRVEDADALAAAGVPTVFFRFDGLADVPRVLRATGALLGTDGETPAAAFERRIGAVRTAVAGAIRPRVLVLVSDETPYTFGAASYVSDVVEAAGGVSVTDAFPEPAAVAGEEWVIGAAPEVVVVLAEPYDAAGLTAHHPAWRALPAVRAGRVHGFDPDLMSRPGPRLADGVETLARLLHPDRFEAP